MDKDLLHLVEGAILLFIAYKFISTVITDRKEEKERKAQAAQREKENEAARRRYEKCGEFGSEEYWEVMTPIFKDIRDIFYQFTTSKETREKNEALKAIMEKMKE